MKNFYSAFFNAARLLIFLIVWMENIAAQDLQSKELVLPLGAEKHLVNALFTKEEDYLVAEWVTNDKSGIKYGLSAIAYPSLTLINEVSTPYKIEEWFFLPNGKLWVSYNSDAASKSHYYTEKDRSEIRNFPGIDTVTQLSKGIKVDFMPEWGVAYAPQLSNNGYFQESIIGLTHQSVLDTNSIYRTDVPVCDVAMAPNQKVAALLFADSTFEIRSTAGNALMFRGRCAIHATDLLFANNSRYLYLLNKQTYSRENIAEVVNLSTYKMLPAVQLGSYDLIQPSTDNQLLAVVKNYGKTLLLLQTDSVSVIEEADLAFDEKYSWSTTAQNCFQLLSNSKSIVFLSSQNNRALQVYDLEQWLSKKKNYNKIEMGTFDWGLQHPQPVLNAISANADQPIVYSAVKVFVSAGNSLTWYNPIAGKVVRKFDLPDAKNWTFDTEGNRGIYLQYSNGKNVLYEADLVKGTLQVREIDVSFGWATPYVLYWPERESFFIYTTRLGYLYNPKYDSRFAPIYFTESVEKFVVTGKNTLLGRANYYGNAYKQYQTNNLNFAVVGDSLIIQSVWPVNGSVLRVNDRIFVQHEMRITVFDLALNKLSDLAAYNQFSNLGPSANVDPTGRYVLAKYYNGKTWQHIVDVDADKEVFQQTIDGYGVSHQLLSKNKMLRYGYEGYQLFDTDCRCTSAGAKQMARYDKETLQATASYINTGYGIFNLNTLSRENYPTGKAGINNNDGLILEDDSTFVTTGWIKETDGKQYAAIQLYHFVHRNKLRQFSFLKDGDESGIELVQLKVEGRELLVWFNKLIKGKGKESWMTKSKVSYLKRINIDTGNEWMVELESDIYKGLLLCGKYMVLTKSSTKKEDYSQVCDVYDWNTGQFVKSFRHTQQNYHVPPVPLGSTEKFFHALGSNNEVCIIDINTEARVGKNFIKLPSAVSCLYTAQKNDLLLCGLNNGMIYVYKNNNIDAPVAVLQQNNSAIQKMAYSNGKVWAYTYDRQIKCWQLSTGQLLFTLHIFPQKVGANEYIFITPKNDYYSSKNVQQHVHFNYNNTIYSLRQFDLQYNRPDKLLQLANGSNKALIDLYYKAWQKRLVNAGADSVVALKLSVAPTATLLQREKINPTTSTPEVTLQVLFTDSFSVLKSYNVLVNSVPLFSSAGKNIEAQKTKTLTENITIPLSRWSNKIELICTNSKGVSSASTEINIHYSPDNNSKDSSDVYLIAIGVTEYEQPGWNLKYAAKDASDLALALKQKYPLLKYKLLTDEMVNEQNVRLLKKFLLSTKPDDRVILSYSGHGLADLTTGEYYLSSYAMDFKNPSAHGIPYRVVEWLLDSIPARNKLVLIDACQSGAIDKDALAGKNQSDTLRLNENIVAYGKGASVTNTDALSGATSSFTLMQQIFSQQTSSTGATVIAASSGTSPAYENNKTGEGNGVFTYALIKALVDNLDRGTSDYAPEKSISIAQLATYLCPKVSELTNGTQNPEVRNFNNNADWRIW